jgi:DNA-3-methyladenine glycosylase
LPRLGRDFYSRYTPDVARDLLGSVLVRRVGATALRSRIVEVEAYRGADDPASHAYRGPTKRTAVMFGEPGHAYVYFTMGMHYCLNLTTEGEGKAGAVLIRAAKPLEGIEEMERRRGVQDVTKIARGPGNLTKSMGIDLHMNGEDVVTSENLFVLSGEQVREVGVSTRIGISSGKDRLWRYFVEGSPYVSGGRTHN